MGQKSTFWEFFQNHQGQLEWPGSYDVIDKESWTKIWNDLISVSWFWPGWGSHLEGRIEKSSIETFIDRNGISYLAYSLSQVFKTEQVAALLNNLTCDKLIPFSGD